MNSNSDVESNSLGKQIYISGFYKLTLFGGFHLVDSEGKAPELGARKSKALLAWLAINPDCKHPRERLAGLLWPDSEEVAARHSLRQALAELRKIIPAEFKVLDASKEFISLNSEYIDIDVQRFLQSLSRGDEDSLDEAIELYSGDFLEGCNPHSDMFEEWGMAYRNDFNERVAVAIDTRLSHYLKAKNYRQVVNLGIRLIAIDPVRESAYRALMLSHSRLGNHASALRWYRRCQQTLQQHLDTNTDPETEALYHDELHHLVAQKDTVTNIPDQKPKLKDTSAQNVSIEDKENHRVIHQIKMAMSGVLNEIGGQSLLIRGEQGVGKSELTTKIMSLAQSEGFFCCRKKLSDGKNDAYTGLENSSDFLKELNNSFSKCLFNYPNITDINLHTKKRNTCSIGSSTVIASSDIRGDKNIAKLVKITSEFQPVLLVVEHIHEANIDTLNLLAELISSAGNCSMILLMTSQFEGEPLDPVWRGAMRGAPLTTIDMT